MLNRETEEYVDRLRQVSPDAQPMWWFDCDTCRGRRSIPPRPSARPGGGRSKPDGWSTRTATPPAPPAAEDASGVSAGCLVVPC